MGETFLWWLAIEVIGLVGLPLTSLTFANLPDRGWSLAKPFSLLIFGWLIWFPLTLITALPFSRAWIIGTLLVYGLVNLLLVLRVARVKSALAELLSRQRGYLALSEALFAGAFAAMVWERSFTPAIVDTEKFMDVAFLSSIWRAPHLPPPDPWLSGQPINYYYFGHYLIALVAKLCGTVPGVAFNLGVGLIFALAAVAIFGVAANLFATASPAHHLWRGLVGLASAAFVLVLGNLNSAQVWWKGAQDLARQLPALSGSPWAWWLHRDLWTGYDWWAPSRVIPSTINEFPAFSFVLADLHAHVLALPFTTVAIGLAYNFVLARKSGIHVFGDGRLSLIVLFASGILLGGLYAINGWDLPTYLGLVLLALAIQQWRAHEREFTTSLLTDFLTVALLLGALCLACYLPFYRDYSSPGDGVGLLPASARTPIGYEVAIFGLPLFLMLSLAFVRLMKRRPAPAVQVMVALMAVLTLGAWLVPAQPLWTLLFALLVIVICAYLAVGLLGLRFGPGLAMASDDDAPADAQARSRAWFWCLFGTAVALIAACELVFLRDVFAFSENFRMNTVFKLYYQAWLLLGVIAGPALFWLLAGAARGLQMSLSIYSRSVQHPSSAGVASFAMALPGTSESGETRAKVAPHALLAAVEPPGDSMPRGTVHGASASSRSENRQSGSGSLRLLRTGGIVLWILACITLVGAATMYPVLATAARTNNFTLGRSLDGTAYMDTDLENKGDAQAIAWLNAHVQGDAVIVEGALSNEYTHYGRISAFTGLPTLMGWGGHEYQWRVNWQQQAGRGSVIEHVIEQRLDAVTQIYTNTNTQQVLALLHQYSVRYVYVGAAEHHLYPSANLGRFATFLRVAYHSADVTIYAVP